MKILLINPPTIHTKGSGKPTLGVPVGILYVAAVLEKRGHEVEVYDTKINYNIEKIGEYVYFGDKSRTIREMIEKVKPDVVGISNQYTIYTPTAKKVSRIVKAVDKKIPVIVGGAHASVEPFDLLKEKSIDYVVMAEGEYRFSELVNCLDNKKNLKDIDGIGYKIKGKLKVNPVKSFIENVDELPFPAYHLVDMEKYFKGLFVSRSEHCKRVVSMVTSRGCPFNCIFCSIHLHMSKRWRAHSVDYVLRHIKHLIDEYKVELIHFEDDNFTLDKKRFEAILDGMLNEKIKVTWDTPNGVRADTFNKELLKKSKKSGCRYLIIGVESGNQEVVNEIIRKGLNLKRVVNVAKWCNELGLDLEAFFVVGFPGETISQMRDTFRFAKMLNEKYSVYPHFNIATPLVHTRLYDIVNEKGYLVKETDSGNLLTAQRTGGCMIRTPDFGPEDIDVLFKKYNFFIKKARLKKVIKRPYLLRSYLIKEISKTPVYNFVKRLYKA